MGNGARRTAVWLAAAGVISIACTGSSGDSGGSACRNYGDALTVGLRDCNRSTLAPSRVAEVSARVEQACALALSAPGTGLTASAIDACAAEVRESCGLDDACEDALGGVTGSLDDGAPCDEDHQCKGGRCVVPATSSVASCGTCGSRLALGATCVSGDACVAGARCVLEGTSTTGKCEAVKTIGEGEVCYDPANPSLAVKCAKGLHCAFADSGPVRCTRLSEAGGPCQNSRDCTTKLGCSDGKCGSPGGDGTACTDDASCTVDFACDQQTRKCVARVWAKTGEACDGRARRCERGSCDGLGSSTATGTCVDFLADGATCHEKATSGPRCNDFARCLDGTCQLPDPKRCK